MSSKTQYPRPGYLINRAARLFMRLNEMRLSSHGVAIGQVPVLASLSRPGCSTMTQKELTEIADVEQPSMAQLLSRMERDGLIERTPDPQDRRTNLVRLTEQGEAAVPPVRESLEYFNTHAYAGFSDEERVLFVEMLQRIIANLESLPESGKGAPDNLLSR